MSATSTVFRKELTDALRDRRTWLIVLVTSILAGPLTLFLLSIFISSVEEGAAKREIYVANGSAAPTLINFLQRAGATVKDAPDDYAAQIKSGRLQNAVIVVPDKFEQRLAAGETIRLPVMFDETATRSQPATRTTLTAVRVFARELGVQRLLARERQQLLRQQRAAVDRAAHAVQYPQRGRAGVLRMQDVDTG